MAEIQKRTETVVSHFYRVDLSQEEIEVLYVVLGKVAGDAYGYRGVSHGIFDAIHRAVGGLSTDVKPYARLTGSLRFSSEK